jgi:soluble lytic murein transglycosylase-like protein
MNEAIDQVRAGKAAVNRIYDVSRALFALVGVTVVLLVALPAPREAIHRQIVSLAAADTVGVSYAAGTIQAKETAGSAAPREQRALAEFLARRFRVAEEAVARFVTTAYHAGGELRVDPLLILAVIAVESRFNPVAESAFGAKGLMQVIPKFHMDKVELLGGQDALLEPEANIQVGTQILREYLRRSGGTESALQMYAGAFDDANAVYSNKVLAERARLEQMLLRLRGAV